MNMSAMKCFSGSWLQIFLFSVKFYVVHVLCSAWLEKQHKSEEQKLEESRRLEVLKCTIICDFHIMLIDLLSVTVT